MPEARSFTANELFRVIPVLTFTPDKFIISTTAVSETPPILIISVTGLGQILISSDFQSAIPRAAVSYTHLSLH